MLSKKPVKPAFSAATMFMRKPTGSRLMSSIADVALAMMLASSSDGKFISRRTSVDDDLDDDADELRTSREQRLAEARRGRARTRRSGRAGRRATACPRSRGTSR